MGVVHGEKILLDGNTPLLIREEVDTNAIRAVFGETSEFDLTRQGGVQIVGFSDEDVFMARTALIGLVL